MQDTEAVQAAIELDTGELGAPYDPEVPKIVAASMRAQLPQEEWLSSGIMVVRNAYLWGEDLIRAAEALPEDRWSRPQAGGEIRDERTGSVLTMWEKVNPELAAYERAYMPVVVQAVTTYCEHNRFASLGCRLKDSGYDLLRYREGDHYAEHIDHGKRVLSLVSFPVGDCAGGELSFPRHKIRIQPEPGLLVVFPSGFTHPHESMPVRRGTKFSIVTWWY